MHTGTSEALFELKSADMLKLEIRMSQKVWSEIRTSPDDNGQSG